ncbi:lipopolysaccharide biosynthesis protein [Methylobacterium sp. A49B]
MSSKRALNGALLTISSKIIGKGIDFITLLVLARTLGPSEFGIVAIAMTLISIIDMITDFPVGAALICMPNISKSHLDTAFTINLARSFLIASVTAALSVPFAAIYGMPQLHDLVLALSLCSVARGMTSPGIALTVKNLDFRPTFIIETFGKAIGSIAAITCAYMGAGVWSIVVNTVVAPAASSSLSYIIAPCWPRLTFLQYKYFLSFSGWLSLSKAFAAFNWQYDRLLLGKFVDHAQFGRYTMANDIAALPAQSLILPTVTPMMSTFAKSTGNRPILTQQYERCLRAVSMVGVPIFFGLSVAADPLVRALLGEKWLSVVPFLQIIAIEPIFYLLTQPFPALAAALGKTKILFNLSFVEFMMKLPVIAIGAWQFGAEGVILSRLLCSFVLMVITMYCLKSMIGLSPFTQLRQCAIPLTAGAAMYCAVGLLGGTIAGVFVNIYVTTAVVVSVGAMAYLLALLIAGYNIKSLVAVFR